jgi:nucleoside-diphosphate-sugar epimerase
VRPAARRILLTGATGSFGRYIARELLARGCELFLLVRGRDGTEATRRVLAALDLGYSRARVTVVPGDLSSEDLRLTSTDHRMLRTSIDGIVHAAATTSFGLPIEAAREVNVGGLRNVLSFAETIDALRGFGYVSTAFVAGKRVGAIAESELAHEAGFVTTYERSKYEAELVIGAHAGGFPVTIFRPSVVVGSHADARTKPNGLHFTLSLVRNGLLLLLPATEETRIDLIDARDAAAALVSVFLGRGHEGTYHLATGARAPYLNELMRAAGAPEVRFADEETFAYELDGLRRAHPEAAALYDRLSTFIGIVAHPKIFETAAAEAALGRPVRRRDPLAAVRALFHTPPRSSQTRRRSTRSEVPVG